MPSQLDQLHSMAASCMMGRAGSAVLMTHCSTYSGQPALTYLKLFPLTSDTEAVTHFLGVHTDLPLTHAERAALLAHCSQISGGSFPNSTGASSSSPRPSLSRQQSQHQHIVVGIPPIQHYSSTPIESSTVYRVPALALGPGGTVGSVYVSLSSTDSLSDKYGRQGAPSSVSSTGAVAQGFDAVNGAPVNRSSEGVTPTPAGSQSFLSGEDQIIFTGNFPSANTTI